MKKLIGMLLAGVFAVTASSTAWSQSYKSDKKMRKSDKKAQKASYKPVMTSNTYYGYGGSRTKVTPNKTKTKTW